MAEYKSKHTGAAIDAGIDRANAALPASGGTMTGPLILSGDPASAKEAATKEYVDNHSAGNAVQYVEQTLTTDQQTVARTNIGAASQEEVDILSEEIEQLKNNADLEVMDATKTGEVVTVTPVAGTTAKVVSKITGQDTTWQRANVLQLRHLTGKNLFDFTQYFGGAGKVYSQDGLTATINDNGTVTVKGTNTAS